MDLLTDGLQLLYGDCLARMDSLPAGSVDLVLCDPPYGTTACRWDSVIPLDPMWQAVDRLSKPRTPAVFTAAQPFTTALIGSNLTEFRYCWYWEKGAVTGFANAKKQPLRHVEDVVVFYAKQPTYNPQGLKPHGKKRVNHIADGGQSLKMWHDSNRRGALRTPGLERVQAFTNYPRQLLTIPRDSSRVHPTQKPVELMAYLIRTYTNPGDVVLDFTMGSGTTGVAAVQEGRQFIGVERDPEYYALACNRIMAARAC